jgi:hypothetical protein
VLEKPFTKGEMPLSLRKSKAHLLLEYARVDPDTVYPEWFPLLTPESWPEQQQRFNQDQIS